MAGGEHRSENTMAKKGPPGSIKQKLGPPLIGVHPGMVKQQGQGHINTSAAGPSKEASILDANHVSLSGCHMPIAVIVAVAAAVVVLLRSESVPRMPDLALPEPSKQAR